VPPWFTCWRLRPVDASAACICRRGRWARVPVLPCRPEAWFHRADGRWVPRGMVLPCGARDGRSSRFRTLALVGKQDGTRGMRCEHEGVGVASGCGPETGHSALASP
jgi:hypothetical protein